MRNRFAGLAGVMLAGVVQAGSLVPTPQDVEGPFYPDVVPSDTDNDLTAIRGHERPARGERIRLEGRVVDTDGAPLAGVRIELWQTDAGGRYIHSGDPLPGQRDPGFQGFGVSLTDEGGRYAFATVVPAGYSSRPPHFHLRLLRGGDELLVTQLYLPRSSGERGISAGRLALREAAQTVRLGQSAGGPVVGRFDFVLEKADE
ncbi:MAG: intradiol ring-cleavage dioxygenase [Rhodocyclaceae bacterium]|nr:intradiol ring-cleavage dioxygenase [Rhodocyclaceae bacterium]